MTGIHTLHPVGEIDLATADAVVTEWLELVDRERPATVVVDLGEVTFVDSGGLSALIRLHKRVIAHGGRVLLRSASWQLRRVLSITALDRSFPDAHLPPDNAGPVTSDR
jgi:anti-anti-sigma factor